MKSGVSLFPGKQQITYINASSDTDLAWRTKNSVTQTHFQSVMSLLANEIRLPACLSLSDRVKEPLVCEVA